MQRVQNFSPASQVPAATLNAIQDQALGIHNAGGLWLGRRPVLASSGGTNLSVGNSGGVCVGSIAAPTTAAVLPGVGATIVLAGLAANTWYYVYAYNSGTPSAPTIAYEYVTTAPYASNPNVKDSTAMHAYIGSFRTDGGALVIPFRTIEGEHLYRWSALAGTRTDLLCLGAGVSAAFADVILRNASLVSLIPPHTRIAYLRAQVNGAIGTYAQVRTKGDVIDAIDLPALIAAPAMTTSDTIIEADSALTIQYTKGTATDLTLYVTGFRE